MTIIWNDPDNINGNNYIVNSIVDISNNTAIISYNDNSSEAEVFINELEIIKEK